MLALHKVMNSGIYEIESLFTTVNKDNRRTAIHGVREEILDAQASSLGLPLRKVPIPDNCTNEEYEQIMEREMRRVKQAGVEYVVFGDIFLEDVRKYREKNLSSTGIVPLFPLWGESTRDMMNQFLSLGYQTIITAVDHHKLSEKFLGKVIDQDILKTFPKNVDICGENGEYHTLVVDGPLFKEPVRVKTVNRMVEGEYYIYQDVKLL